LNVSAFGFDVFSVSLFDPSSFLATTLDGSAELESLAMTLALADAVPALATTFAAPPRPIPSLDPDDTSRTFVIAFSAAAAAAARAAAAIGVDEASKRSTTRALRSSSVARLSVRRDRLARHDRAPAPASPARVASTRALDVDIARDLAERPSATGAESDCAVRDFADTR
jgi:hypothetical protein|tara:strand:- start:23579 stop:24088 length:510 start_codon:yes stop_codon:yes gene_type:complete